MTSKDIINNNPSEVILGKSEVIITSKEMGEEQLFTKPLNLGNKKLEFRGITKIGAPNKRFNEDGCAVIKDGNNLIAVVVDGGTQVEPVPSLGDTSGGKYISDSIIEFVTSTTDLSAHELLNRLNANLRAKNTREHPEINYSENAMNVPYGSIAAVRISTEDNTIEVANAGDVFVLAVDINEEPTIVTKDDVYQKDQQTYAAARTVATTYGITIREAMEKRDKDPRFKPIIEEMYETMRQGNTGEIPRITGSDVFRTHIQILPLDRIKQLFVFSDGAVPVDMDVHTIDGARQFLELIQKDGISKLVTAIKTSAQKDPDFENHPRFRDIDDLLILQLDFE